MKVKVEIDELYPVYHASDDDPFSRLEIEATAGELAKWESVWNDWIAMQRTIAMRVNGESGK